MFILKKGHQPGVYVSLRALFLVFLTKFVHCICFVFTVFAMLLQLMCSIL